MTHIVLQAGAPGNMHQVSPFANAVEQGARPKCSSMAAAGSPDNLLLTDLA